MSHRRNSKYEDCLSGDNALLLEEVYTSYTGGNADLPSGWEELFSSVSQRNSFEVQGSAEVVKSSNVTEGDPLYEVSNILNFFRHYGHLSADLDPLKMTSKVTPDYEHYIASIDPRRDGSICGKTGLSLPSVLKKLHEVYCGKIGFEFMHIHSHEERYWLQDKIENFNRMVSTEEKKWILNHLQELEIFEQFLHVRYPGYKRFSVEGGDSLVLSLERIVSLSPRSGIGEIVLGMSHRGRLSVLTKVLRKPYVAVMHEFSGGLPYPEELGVSGDVKYHLGYSCDREAEGGVVHLSLTYNPSHLEAVNPVVMGRVKAKNDGTGALVLGVLVHGDASFIGQGVVAEGFTLSGVDGYSPSGLVHIVVNNQIGFTTSPDKSRTSLYCSDMAKMVDAPIFHVNGDDPESVVLVTELAMEYRNKFRKDVVIDIVCYRRFGHNEGDEPMFTQPLMYNNIAKHPTVSRSYEGRLIAEGVITSEEAERSRSKFREVLDNAFAEVGSYKPEKADCFGGVWDGLMRPKPGHFQDYISDTGVEEDKLLFLAKAISTLPEWFTPNAKIAKVIENRLEGVGKGAIDWGMAESLAFASLLAENYKVRLSGEDCGRGTFSHRHARLVDQVTGLSYVPLENLGVDQEKIEIIDSPLSEYAVLGFEYGYSLDSPNVLVLWEAQFGDFANGAQIIIDQFLVSAETKWLRSSGLVLLLPHGYEGQGPEHSSARIERYLELCAEDNIQVVNCTTPANYFHVLRRQLHRKFRKPLVVFTPKSLLRHKGAVSRLSDFKGNFLPVLGEVADLDHEKVRKVVVCSGKIYYDLLEARETRGDVVLIRLEQYYPFPTDLLACELAKYPGAEVIWCQEEPANMGGWDFVRFRIAESMMRAGIPGDVSYIGREASASTASGYASVHAVQQRSIIDSVFKYHEIPSISGA